LVNALPGMQSRADAPCMGTIRASKIKFPQRRLACETAVLASRRRAGPDRQHPHRHNKRNAQPAHSTPDTRATFARGTTFGNGIAAPSPF
jgi:hypothetical protein